MGASKDTKRRCVMKKLIVLVALAVILLSGIPADAETVDLYYTFDGVVDGRADFSGTEPPPPIGTPVNFIFELTGDPTTGDVSSLNLLSGHFWAQVAPFQLDTSPLPHSWALLESGRGADALHAVTVTQGSAIAGWHKWTEGKDDFYIMESVSGIGIYSARSTLTTIAEVDVIPEPVSCISLLIGLGLALRRRFLK